MHLLLYCLTRQINSFFQPRGGLGFDGVVGIFSAWTTIISSIYKDNDDVNNKLALISSYLNEFRGCTTFFIPLKYFMVDLNSCVKMDLDHLKIKFNFVLLRWISFLHTSRSRIQIMRHKHFDYFCTECVLFWQKYNLHKIQTWASC